MKELRYLIGAIPIIGLLWYGVITAKMDGDFASDIDFYIVSTILALASSYVIVDVYNRLGR